jgi:type II secretory pathway pseudopilin PulG
MKNSRGVSLIALIITIIVIIILAAIVMNASTSTVGNAQYARFAQEFGEFNDQVSLDAANVKSQTGIKGQIINNAQMFYMTANGITNVSVRSGDASQTDEKLVGCNTEQGVAGYTMPVGYVLTNYNKTKDGSHPYVLQSILGIGSTKEHGSSKGDDASGDRAIDVHVAYVINDGKISNYNQYGANKDNGSASHEFYGDSNGEEYHFVTSRGDVFTLPGFPVQQSDGSIEYHIDSKNGHYYVVTGNSGLEPKNGTDGEVVQNVNNDVITNKQPILAHYLWETKGINARTGARVGTAEGADGVENASADIAKVSQKVIKPGETTAGSAYTS